LRVHEQSADRRRARLSLTLIAIGLVTTLLAPAASVSAATSCASLQWRVNVAAAGAVIQVPNCIYQEQVTITKKLTLIGPATVAADSRQYAFVIEASDVTIEGFTVTGGTAPKHDGVVHAAGVDRFTFRNGKVTGARNGACIDINGGTGHLIVDSEFAYCAQQGWHIHDNASNVLILRNHNHHNNPTHRYGFADEAGGGKISRSTVILSKNHIHHNLGPGIWCDPCYWGTTIAGNRVHHNASMGIFYEAGSGGRITANMAWENSWWGESEWAWGYGAGIVVSSSRATEVAGNIVAWNPDGIVVLSQQRSDSPGNDHNYVHHNTIVMAPQPAAAGDESFALGWLQDWSGGMFSATKDNRGTANQYWHSKLEPTLCRFAWGDCLSRMSTFNGTPGEQGGLYLTNAYKDAFLKALKVPTMPEGH
jgi:hypothetical protein